jgi:transketolase
MQVLYWRAITMKQSDEERRRRNREKSAKYRRENPEKWKEIDRRSKLKLRQNPEKNLQKLTYQQQYREENRKALSDKERQRRFGITPEGYSDLFKSQNGTCAICKQPETATRLGKVKALAVDHCHRSGVVRGLLCADCNTGIGKLKENKNILLSAIRYLDKHSEQSSNVVS